MLDLSQNITPFIQENAPSLIMLLIIVGVFLLFRTKSTKLASIEEFDAQISSGQPVVVELFSNT
jgi:hypothetical protein